LNRDRWDVPGIAFVEGWRGVMVLVPSHGIRYQADKFGPRHFISVAPPSEQQIKPELLAPPPPSVVLVREINTLWVE
jgi:hypothetical protein